ncbi:sugar ABC transporter substrate-binding protein [Streptomyces sp. 8L]|uniref:sugar ABC transporter substrate-binding protein n=1 Tax=Streptomyces sp. 8L TaxID=2877242 RepID=UPI001CD78024|nr:sugar ABC transporter substrate-binding protein [Streptomyces sp. 8L]MCA1221427.1 sugar ABC transporter substrate-binding protein [Streptomyces sp. 8L]
MLRGAGLAGMAAGMVALAGCGSDTKSGGSDTAGSFPATPKWKFVFVNHVTTNPFFQATQYGIQDACSLLNVTYQWTGSETSNVSQMVSAMNTAITSGADGIAVSLVDQSAFNAPVKQALAKNIPVVSYNADVTTNARLAYVGQDLFAAGQAMGKRIASLFPDGGSIAVFIATPGSLNIQPRADGAVAALKASGGKFTVKQVATGADVNPEQAAVDAFTQGNKAFRGLFAVDAGSTQGIANVMRKYSLRDQGYHGGGFDLLTPTEQAISDGILDFTIDQSAYLQGFLSVLYLYLYKLSGTLVSPPITDTGLKFVTKDLVTPYLKAQNRFEGSSPKQVYIH